MQNKELTEYIQSEVQKGVPKETIMTALTGAGWASEDIEEAMQLISFAPVKKSNFFMRWANPSVTHISTSVSITLAGGLGACFSLFLGSETLSFTLLFLVILLSILFATSGLIGAFRITPTHTRERLKQLTYIVVALVIIIGQLSLLISISKFF